MNELLGMMSIPMIGLCAWIRSMPVSAVRKSVLTGTVIIAYGALFLKGGYAYVDSAGYLSTSPAASAAVVAMGVGLLFLITGLIRTITEDEQTGGL